MEFLTGLLENNNVPWITAILLGLLTAVSPCPLATNITAIGFISRDVTDRKKVFYNGIFYTAGRAITYTGLALIIILGADQFKFSGFFQQYGEKIIGPLLLVIGIVMLDLITIKFPVYSKFTGSLASKKKFSYTEAVLLGLLLALAFCPYSGVLYFGMLIPLAVTNASNLYLPLIFAIATAIPVIVIAWMLAFMINKVSNIYNRLKAFEIWFRRFAAVLFIIIGLYYIVRIYFLKQ